MNDKELLLPRSMTSAELKVLVDEYVADGGKITVAPPSVALNFRMSALDTTEQLKQRKRHTIIKKRK